MGLLVSRAKIINHGGRSHLNGPRRDYVTFQKMTALSI